MARLARRTWRGRIRRLRAGYSFLLRALHRTALAAGAHGCFNLAQSTAYSAIVALFPTLLVAAAVIGLLPDTAPLRFQLAAFFERVLPPGVSPLLDAAFENSPAHAHSMRALISAALVSFLGASNIISTLMEGLRRARDLPISCWSFWQRRRRTFELVPLSLIPLAAASLLIVFGHAVTSLLVSSIGPVSRTPIYMVAVLVRWAICFAASVGVIGLIYHLGVPDGAFPLPIPAAIPAAIQHSIPAPIATAGRRSRALWRAASRSTLGSALITPSFAGVPGGEQSLQMPPRRWHTVLPGAMMATAMWFLTTLAFGWYVTRFANYGEVYGSIGAAIALLFWLYIISLSVLCGAEFNAQFDLLAAAHPSGHTGQ
ncbi:MAG TPA: YihY/virulence factor BrkB family protein [Acidobacteriaceae bacterium]|nr:YihY/virulence factor BrkB family protein [Acidobacteriaceae bacterium]